MFILILISHLQANFVLNSTIEETARLQTLPIKCRLALRHARMKAEECPWCGQRVKAGVPIGHLRLHPQCYAATGFRTVRDQPVAPPPLFLDWARPPPKDLPDVLEQAATLERAASLMPKSNARVLMGTCSAALQEEDFDEIRIASFALAAHAVHRRGKPGMQPTEDGLALLVNLATPIALQGLLADFGGPNSPLNAGGRKPDDWTAEERLVHIAERRRFTIRLFDLVEEVKRLDVGGLGPPAALIQDEVLEWVDDLDAERVQLGGSPLVNWHDVADAMEWSGDEEELLDPKDGSVKRSYPASHADRSGSVPIPKLEPSESLEDRRAFATTLGGPDAERCGRALLSPHPFREFRRVLAENAELTRQWRIWHDGRMRSRVQAWVKETGLRLDLVDR